MTSFDNENSSDLSDTPGETIEEISWEEENEESFHDSEDDEDV